MIEPVSDPIAVQVTDDIDDLLRHGAVRFCGYVKVETLPDGTVDPAVANFRVYTSPSFDRWLEIDRDVVLAQLGPNFHTQGRSYVWVAADAVVTKCQSAAAVFVSQAMDAGDDDPTAFPRGGH